MSKQETNKIKRTHTTQDTRTYSYGILMYIDNGGPTIEKSDNNEILAINNLTEQDLRLLSASIDYMLSFL